MKDIIITGKRIRREILITLIIFLFAILLNVYAIISYETGWSELISEIPFILLISVVIYVFLSLVRIIFSILKYTFIRK